MKGWQLLTIWASFFVGIVLADGFVVSERFYIVGLGVALVTALLWRRGWLQSVAWSLGMLVMLVGIARMEYAERQFADSQFASFVGQAVTVTGEVVREPDKRESFTQLYVETEEELLLVRTDRFTDIPYGDTVVVLGTLSQSEPFLTDSGRVFDYPNYLQARGVQYVVSFAQTEVIERGGGHTVFAGLYQIKNTFAAAVNASLPPPQSDLGLGLLLGIKQALGEDLEDAFRRTGLIHIVVLSGYNVMLVIAFFWWVTSWVLPLRGRVVVSVVGIVLFAVMVGLSATVVRASIMAGILLLAKFIGARYDVLRALLFAGLVMVVLNPYLLLYDLGFQLSFMATLGLVLFLPQFEGTVATETRSLGLRDIFLATCITQLFVLPLLIFHIGEVSVVSVMVNVLVLPVVAVAMGLTFITGLVALVSTTVALPLAWVSNLVLSYIILVVTWFDQLPWAAVELPAIGVLELVGLYALLGLGWYRWQQHTPPPPPETNSLVGWDIQEESDPEIGPDSEPPVFLR